MNEDNKIFVTTTLPYVNSKPHIGHSLEFIQADAIARAYRTYYDHKNVFLNVGIDEHGSKVYKAAQALNRTPKEHCDILADEWVHFCHKFNIAFSNFYRTTDATHYTNVTRFWNDCLDRGDLYKKSYEGKYCEGCESFKHDKDLVDGKCPDHQTEPQSITEENWFFRLSKYKDKLQELASRKDFLYPSRKIDELVNLIVDAEDLSVSRPKTTVPWGIPVPGDDDQVIYVWFEALLNYVFAGKDPAWWDEAHTIQLCGPDNIRFQGSIFQALLLSGDRKPTDRLFVHGTVLGPDGTKMSKTVGNVVDPIDQLEKYGVDAVRYYTLACLSPAGNSAWSELDLVNRCNADLADNLGNLLARVLHLVQNDPNVILDIDQIDKAHLELILSTSNSGRVAWGKFQFDQACAKAQELLRWSNQYINEEKPWSNTERKNSVLSTLVHAIEAALDVLEPAIPDLCAKARTAIKTRTKIILFEKIK